ncbi:MAG: hypothetical protein KGM42_02545 [Hyphomicrobiales bacterium]|nr:hypothetical protein [Hyphomicrobiales bacterium]
MTQSDDLAESRVRAAGAGLTPDDMTWLDGLNWRDAAVPAVTGAAQLADYQRRERALNAAVAHLSFAERAESPEGKLAAAIGAKVADWKDKASGEDTD